MNSLLLTLVRIAPMLLILSLSVSRTAAQLTITPTRIVIGSGNPTREVTLRNDGIAPLEVTTRMMFGLWRTDATNNRILDSTGSTEEIARSCSDWIKVFPKQLTLAPGATRKIRLLVTPPPGVPDGEYLARFVVTSTSRELPSIPVASSDNSITGTLQGQLSVSLEVMYRKGVCQTGVDFRILWMRRGEALVAVQPAGNATYRGTLSGVVRTADGAVADSTSQVFVATIPLHVTLPFRDIPAGTYRLTLESRAVLPGSASETVLPSPPVRKDYDLIFNGTDITVTPRTE